MSQIGIPPRERWNEKRAIVDSDISESYVNIKPKLEDVLSVEPINNRYIINDVDAYITQIRTLYDDSYKMNLHPEMENRIRDYISSNNGNVQASLPGLHAEVIAVNSMLNRGYSLNEIDVSTFRATNSRQDGTSNQGEPFKACENCTNILHTHIKNTSTGVTPK